MIKAIERISYIFLFPESKNFKVKICLDKKFSIEIKFVLYITHDSILYKIIKQCFNYMLIFFIIKH